MELKEFVEAQVVRLREESEMNGILRPFLFTKGQEKMIAAMPIKTKRDESLNVCWACLQEKKMTPNGIFFSFNESEHELVEVVYLPLYTKEIYTVTLSSGNFTVSVCPLAAEYATMFGVYKAKYVKDKKELR